MKAWKKPKDKDHVKKEAEIEVRLPQRKEYPGLPETIRSQEQ